MTDQLHGPSESDPAEHETAEHETADSLRIARPVPAAAFRGRLGRYLADRDPGYGPRPERLRLIVAGYVGAGGLLIALAALVFS
jgi:hypothetical protein